MAIEIIPTEKAFWLEYEDSQEHIPMETYSSNISLFSIIAIILITLTEGIYLFFFYFDKYWTFWFQMVPYSLLIIAPPDEIDVPLNSGRDYHTKFGVSVLFSFSHF